MLPWCVGGIAKCTTCLSTPAAPGDYDNRSSQVVFNVTTQTGTLVVHTETDNIIENDEDFTAVLSVPAGLPRVFEGTPSEATVTILDQTTAEVYFDPAAYNVTEGQPADLILRLTRDVDPSVTIIMGVQTINESATGVYILYKCNKHIIEHLLIHTCTYIGKQYSNVVDSFCIPNCRWC